MEITVDRLQEGDEVLIGLNGNLRYAKVLRTPKLAKTLNRWGEIVYKTVLCSVNENKVNKTKTYLDGSGVTRSYTYTKVEQVLSPLDHNKKVYINMNDRKMWLVKRD